MINSLLLKIISYRIKRCVQKLGGADFGWNVVDQALFELGKQTTGRVAGGWHTSLIMMDC